MKKILITGANSYIGTSFERYLNERFPDDYAVDTVDMTDETWHWRDFSGYDAVVHVAGIAHQKETKANAPTYYTVNRDLAVETAQKAKADGIRHFVFLSTMSVYGRDTGVITRDTAPAPKTHYGLSKLQAETGIRQLADDRFRVCILRPPMVYGEGCKGNYQMVVKIAEKSPIFPKIRNQRSTIHVHNLASFIKLCLDKELSGTFFPQNRDYACTLDMAMAIARRKGKMLHPSYLAGLLVWLLRPFVGKLKKAFGSLTYVDTEDFDFTYCILSSEDT